MSKGVPKGYKEDWTYRGRWSEKKIGPKKWKVNFKATKRRKAGMGQLKPGTTIVWAIKGRQYAVKRGKGHYDVRLIADKKLIRINPRTNSDFARRPPKTKSTHRTLFRRKR